MPTERTTVARAPCPCGRGALRVEITYDDSDWGNGDRTAEGIIECAFCKPLYGFVAAGRGMDVVRAQDLACAQQLRANAAQLNDGTRDLKEVADVVEQVAKELDALPSVAAKYRLLQQLQLEIATLPTFRKHIRKSHMRKWLNNHRSFRELISMFAHVGADAACIVSRGEEAEKLRAAAAERLKPVLSLGPISLAAGIAGSANRAFRQ